MHSSPNNYNNHRPPQNQPRVLFILKRREDFHDCPSYSQNGLSTGLLNSASFVQDMLIRQGVESKTVVVIDNNDIDREVSAFKPTHVIIEAIWVVPEKFDVLSRLHPTVKWVVRYHSETPFIANEGIAMSWLFDYARRPNVYIGINAPRFMDEVRVMLRAAGLSHSEVQQRVIFLPNYYPIPQAIQAQRPNTRSHIVNVGCFGAIRPLKNHLLQATAALRFANMIGKVLLFHVNIGRVEMKGDPILNNLKAMFDNIGHSGHQLIIHKWAPHDKFIELVKNMDIGLQVSFSETFNIVAADMVTSGIPVVVSNEIPWAKAGVVSSTTSSVEIARTLKETYEDWNTNIRLNNRGLRGYVETSTSFWLDFLQRQTVKF
ncbi:MAG: hypothetical protein CTY12_04970 [Methylotenera sp.]|nr:MAG: hypothetical protein CTY12_04970 [Methylotenera sp.]